MTSNRGRSNSPYKTALKPRAALYKLWCKQNNRAYIGSTSDVCMRRSSHFSKLRKKKHPIKELQEDYNKYGESNVCFIIIRYTDYLTKDERLEEEELCFGRESNLYNKRNFAKSFIPKKPESYRKVIGRNRGIYRPKFVVHVNEKTAEKIKRMSKESKLSYGSFLSLILEKALSNKKYS